jgi:hypothetical protein
LRPHLSNYPLPERLDGKRVLDVATFDGFWAFEPERMGRFDLVFISAVFLHLMNPMKALNNVCSVTSGQAVIVNVFEPRLPEGWMIYESGITHNTWGSMSFGSLETMIRDAGFTRVELKSQFRLGYWEKPQMWQAAFLAAP